jgi:hypothetical protein
VVARGKRLVAAVAPDLSLAADSVTDVPKRWSTESVLALAPDAASQRAAGGLARPSSWSGTGVHEDLVWGLCAGSGRNPYQAVVDLTGPAYKCSCPSRKFPCKHVLALLLNWAKGTVPDEAGPADYALAWQAGRAAAVASRAGAAAKRAGGAQHTAAVAVDAPDAPAPPSPAAEDTAAARRSRQRAGRVAAGVAELRTWLRDQVWAGLSGAAGRYGHAEPIAARMVDAQAPGLATTLRRLSVIPASGDGWPARLLGEYARLHLLARAHEGLNALPPGLAAVVRTRVGYTTGREEVLARPPVTDRWQVLAVRDLPDAPVPARRIWLRGRESGRFALLLSYAAGGYFRGNLDAMLSPGSELHADLHYYPGQPPVRAVTGARHGSPAAGPCPAAGPGVAGLLDDWAAALEQDPWLTEWPALLSGTPVAAEGQWHLVDASGEALPLLARESLWPLLAVSGGRPVTVAGEWSPEGLTALTVWHGDQAVRL